MAYLPDHEPALSDTQFPGDPVWTSGYELAHGVDLLIHDSQFATEEYLPRVGWGHSTVEHAVSFASLCRVRRMVTFHHDPAHDDDTIDRLRVEAVDALQPSCEVFPGLEGEVFDV
jgi:ribonuclease BN (tRNA processing enzyme)